MVGIIKGISDNPTRIKYGMVGGGPDAFFGIVHRKAAAMDGEIELVAGAFSSSPEKSRAQGKELMLDPSRVYGSYQEMAEKEAALPEEERIDFASIVTPNHVHHPAAKVLMEAAVTAKTVAPVFVFTPYTYVLPVGTTGSAGIGFTEPASPPKNPEAVHEFPSATRWKGRPEI